MFEGVDEKRTINESLDLAWSLLRMMPRTMLKVRYTKTSIDLYGLQRIPEAMLDEYYKRKSMVPLPPLK